MQQAEVLEQVILDGGARKQDPFLRFQLAKGSVGLIFTVLQSVPLPHRDADTHTYMDMSHTYTACIAAPHSG